MKKSIYVLLLMVCSNTLLFTQTPNPAPREVQEVPQLQEWWRADNMGYGTEGMTWLDNFYNGKGALVISTPNGVQTWLLQYPWDTVNVFTWQGGNANIKTGDFNGDGVRDYIDEKGNVYKGRGNELPNITTGMKVPFPDLVGDWNSDGFDDVFSFNGIVSTNVSDIGRIYFGASNLDSMSITIIKRAEPFEVQWRTMNCYKSNSGGLHVIFQKGDDKSSTDGYALYSLVIDSGYKDYKVKSLDKLERAIDFGKEFTRSTSAAVNSTTNQYFVSAEMIDGIFNNTHLVVYNLSNDKIEKVSSVRMDSVVAFNHLSTPLIGSGRNNLLITFRGSFPTRSYGVVEDIEKTLIPTIRFDHLAGQLLACRLSSFDTLPKICIAGSVIDPISLENKQHFSFYSLVPSTTLLEEFQSEKTLEIKVHPLPVSSNNLEFTITSPSAQDSKLIIITIDGKVVVLEETYLLDEGDNSFKRTIHENLPQGSYILQCITPSGIYSKKFVIN